MAAPPSKKTRPSSHLVVHDILFELRSEADGSNKLHAFVDCKRRKCRLNVDECRACERLGRIDSHEAGFVVLCRSEDELFEADE